MTTATIIPRMGRKRRPPPKGTRTLRQRFCRRLHELAGDMPSTEIAEKCGVSTATVTRWFSGQVVPDWKYWPPLAEAFGLDDYRELLPPE